MASAYRTDCFKRSVSMVRVEKGLLKDGGKKALSALPTGSAHSFGILSLDWKFDPF